MRGIKRARTAIAAVLVAGVVVVLGTGEPSAGAPPVFSVGTFPPDGGVVRLHLGASDYVRFDAPNGSGGYTAGTEEAFLPSGCNLASPVPASLLITPVPSGGNQQGRAGLVQDAIGVQVKGEGNGTSCGQVNGTAQAIVLSLGGPVAGRAMDFVELDIEAKFGATVRAELFFGGSATPVRTELLPTGGPDSGPDSADNDNFRWRLPSAGAGLVLFDKIRLSIDSSTPGGAMSLEGGADSTAPLPGGLAATALGGTSDSIFHITNIDGILDCGDTVTEGGGGSPEALITLVDEPGCTPMAYSLTTLMHDDGTQSILFQKDADVLHTFRATFVWDVEAAIYPVKPTKIDYGDGAGLHDMQWCDGTPADPIAPVGDPWCVTGQTSNLVSTDQIQVTETVFGSGDPINLR